METVDTASDTDLSTHWHGTPVLIGCFMISDTSTCDIPVPTTDDELTRTTCGMICTLVST